MTRNMDEQERPNAKKKKRDYWLGEAIPTTNRYSSHMEESSDDRQL
jgi:hypothetical protein